MKITNLVLTLSFLFVSYLTVLTQTIPPAIPNTYVQDHANVLSPEDRQLIQNQLTNLKEKYNLEIGVATVDSTGDRPIFDYSLKMAREYGIGSKEGEHRGILLFLAVKDRKYQTQISSHMEAVLTDGQSGELQRKYLVPRLKIASKSGLSADWRDAISATLASYDSQIAKNIEPEVITVSDPNEWSTGGVLAVIFGILIAVVGGICSLFGYQTYKERKEQEAQDAAFELEREERQAEEERRRLKHEAWLLTPEGIKHTKELELERKREREREAARRAKVAKEAEERRLWLLTPEGRVWQKAEDKRNREEAAKRRKQDEIDEELRAARRRREDSSPSYSSQSYSSPSPSYDSGSSGGGFSGGGDFSGGGSGGDW